MDWPKLSLDWLKLKPRYLFGVAITCLVVVALPKGWRQYLGYDGFVEPYRGWISLGALVFSVYGFVMFMANVPSKILGKWGRGDLKGTHQASCVSYHHKKKDI